MEAMKHTGDSANVAFYRADADGVWCEALRSDFTRRNGKHVVYPRPRFHITVYRDGVGEVESFAYFPKSKPKPGRLPERTITRLVREVVA